MADCDHVYIEASEHYQKKSYRNKCRLLGPNGIRSFSIPLIKGKHNGTSIREVKISYDENWSSQLLKLCGSNYRKSPYYDFIIDELSLILKKNHEHLFDLNMELLHWIIRFLELDCEVQFTTEYHKQLGDDIFDMREYFKPGKPLNSPQTAYPQVFIEKHGFVPNLSILDMLFCCGRESLNYL